MSIGWVTFIKDDLQVRKGLALLHSLRATKTGKKVIAITGNVSKENQGKIQYYADTIVPLVCPSYISCVDLYARLKCWSMPGFEKLVFLDKSCVVLRNSDDIFQSLEGKCVYVIPGSDEEDLSVLGMRPDFDVYNKLLNGLKSKDQRESTKTFLEAVVATGQRLKPKFGFRLEDAKTAWKLPIIAIVEDIEKWLTATGGVCVDIATYYQAIIDGVDKQLALSSTINPSLRDAGALEPIAVIGMSCRFPCANNPEEYWDFLMSGESGVRKRPQDRWTEEQGCVLDLDADSREAGWLKCAVDEFDGGFFGMNPMELKFTDPQQRMLIELSYEALEDAGINVQELHGKNVGVFSAAWKDDYKELLIESGFKGTEFFRTTMGNAYSAACARISHVLGLTGPCIASEAGCSASFVSIKEACASLRKNESSLAIVSAVNLLLHPFRWEDMKSFTSKDCRCKTFDAEANGFARAEGVASIVLKKVSDAVRDGDRIYGLIRGMGITQEGTSSSLGTPTVEGEAQAIKLALNEAKVRPEDVFYVEAHGTGTAVGDPIEVNAIAKAYKGQREEPLRLGSVKTNIGHTESAAGLASLIKVLLTFQREQLPPHINLKQMNPALDLAQIPAIVTIKPEVWKKGDKRYAGISNFGITGMDTHMVLEEPPSDISQCRMKITSPQQHIITLSAKTKVALQTLLDRYEGFLNTQTDLKLEDVALTANVGRAHYKYRTALIGSDCTDLANKIRKGLTLDSSSNLTGKNKKVCFLFAGQGSQYKEMGKTLYQLSPVFKKYFDYLCSILLDNYQIDLKKGIWEDEVDSPIHSQVGIFVIEYCISELWKYWGVKPDVILGHSVGEFAACVCANAISVEDGLKLVVGRSKLVQKTQPGGMAVIGRDCKTAEGILKDFTKNSCKTLEIAASNSGSQTAVTGPAQAIDGFLAFCKENGIIATKLKSSVAYHSKLLEPIIPEIENIANSITYKKPSVTFISSLTGQKEDNIDAAYFIRQTREPVRFVEASKLASTSANVFLDVGPHPVLTSLLAQNAGTVAVSEKLLLSSLRVGTDEWCSLMQAVGKLYVSGFDINWKKLHKFSNGNKLSLPHYPFERTKYWLTPKAMGRSGFLGKKEFPMIGSKLESPVNEGRICFVNYLSQTTLPYVKDHKLGEDVVFPGAGYVEMCLEVGKARGCPAALKDVSFHAPLVINEDNCWETHTILTESDGRVEIYCRDVDGQNWTFHAEGKLASLEDMTETRIEPSAITKLLAVLNPSTDTYDRIGSLGYIFGPHFQTIAKIWPGDGEFLAELTLPLDTDHVLHPIIIDAVMQSLVVTWTEDFDHLRMPRKIREFQILRRTDKPLKYAYVKNEGGIASAFLLDSDLTTLAELRGLETARASFKHIKSSAGKGTEESRKGLPMYQETWIPGTNIARITDSYSELQIQSALTERLKNCQIDAVSVEAINALHVGMGKGIMLAFHKLGWSGRFRVGSFVSTESVTKVLGIKESIRLLQRLLEILMEEGILTLVKAPDQYRVERILPEEQTLHKDFADCREKGRPLAKEWEASEIFLQNLVPIMMGEVNALRLLFPTEGQSSTSAEAFYLEAESTKELNQTLKETMAVLLEKASTVWEEGKKINILEVGAGTGSATTVCLPLLEKSGLDFSYTYTDLSSAYFSKAKDKFSKYAANLEFKVFDVEKEPEGQGFSPSTYHIVVASNVLHATVDLKETMQNTRCLMRKGGIIVLLETWIPQRHYDLIVGHLDGYWRFKDFALRPAHCTISEEAWKKLLTTRGFNTVLSTPVFNGGLGIICAESAGACFADKEKTKEKTWLVFSERGPLWSEIRDNLKYQGRNPILVEIGNTYVYDEANGICRINFSSAEDVERILKTVGPTNLEGIIYTYGLRKDVDVNELCYNFLYVVQELARLGQEKPRLVVVTKGVFWSGDQEPSSFPASGALSGMLRTFMTEHPHAICKLIDVDVENECAEIVCNELWHNPKEAIVSVRDGIVHYSRLKDWNGSHQHPPLKIPKDQDFCLQLPESKTIADLCFKPLRTQPLLENEVEVKVRSVGLNFRDVFLVFQSFDKKTVSIGADVAGVVSRIGSKVTKFKIGDAVFGPRSSDVHFPSKALFKENMLMRIPDGMTFEEASTYPVPYSTVHFGFFTCAKMRKGDSVLIHAATGAVGLHAVHVAQKMGATIFATAGSKRKRALLKQRGVPAENIFSSRNLEFAGEILSKGKGPCVDIVLNSLTGPGYKEASLSCCKKGAKFIELGVMNAWTEHDVRTLRPDVSYFAIDLSDKRHQVGGIWTDIFSQIEACVKEEKRANVPITKFRAEDVRNALSYMQAAKHVGKIVCTFPTENTAAQTQSPLFSERGTYLITGGLGGIGLKVCEWMLSKGAKHVLLASRSKPDNNQATLIQKMNDEGGRVFAVPLDVGDFQGCSLLLKKIKENPELPPIKGIMHCAGTLSDGEILQQTKEKLEHTFRSKVNGAMNLHQLTKECNLEHFVLFSSFSGVVGTPGQVNHAAGNTFLDALAGYREAYGLPGISINWGQWGDVGIVAGMKIHMFNPMSTEDCLQALEEVLLSHQSNGIVVDGELSKWKRMFPWTEKYFELLNDESKSAAGKQGTNMANEDFWKAVEASTGSGEVIDLARKATIGILGRLTGQPYDGITQDLDLGLDSLMKIELSNSIQALLGNRSTIKKNAFSNARTLEEITEVFSGVLQQSVGNALSKPVKLDELSQLIKEDSELCRELQDMSPLPPPKIKPSQMESILLLGVTGNLGPYILAELTKNPRIKKVYCIVRAESSTMADKRVTRHLEEYGLLKHINMHKVVPMAGNMSQPEMGLTSATYASLASTVDGVVNLAAFVSHVDIYKRTPATAQSMYSVNVLGVQEVLKFAVAGGKTKYVYLGSTILTVMLSRKNDPNHLSEDWVRLEEFDTRPKLGYNVSKYIGERMAEKAVKEKGIPCQVFRFPNVTGESLTGKQKTNNHFALKYLCYLNAGFVHNVEHPMPILPVDTCAKISLGVWFSDEAKSGVYNIVNPHVESDQILLKLAPSLGFQMRKVEYAEFVKLLESDESPLGALKEFYTDRERFSAMVKAMGCLENWEKNRKSYFLSKKVEKIFPNLQQLCGDPIDVLKTDLSFILSSYRQH